MGKEFVWTVRESKTHRAAEARGRLQSGHPRGGAWALGSGEAFLQAGFVLRMHLANWAADAALYPEALVFVSNA